MMFCTICYHLHNLKNMKNRSVTFSKVAVFYLATLLKVTLIHGCFSRFLNCANGTKSCKMSHTYIYNNFINFRCLLL